MKKPLWWIKLTRYEFWPFWVFYLPALPYGIWLSLRAGSFSYFTAVNPGMHMGGLLNSSKWNVLRKIPDRYVPNMIFVPPSEAVNSIEMQMTEKGLSYPVIAKPDARERGVGVEKLDDTAELKIYLSTATEPFLLQEFINWEVEAGVFYHRHPREEKGLISSVVLKGFLEVEGDGKSNLLKLMEANTRARFRIDYLRKKYQHRLDEVLPKGKIIKLEPIGNHNRGTAFLDGNHLISEEMINTFDALAKQIDGFFYGRFDLKAKSLEDLQTGQNIRIMELNGINSEPAHVYQPGYSLMKAYSEIYWHVKRAWSISVANHKNGVPYASFRSLYGEIWTHLTKK